MIIILPMHWITLHYLEYQHTHFIFPNFQIHSFFPPQQFQLVSKSNYVDHMSYKITGTIVNTWRITLKTHNAISEVQMKRSHA